MNHSYVELEISTNIAVAADTEDIWYRKFTLPGKYRIVGVSLMPHNAVTADPTNYATLTLANVTQSTTIAARSWAATNSVAGTAEALTVGAAAYIASGDVLSLAKADPGTGLAIHASVVLLLQHMDLP